MLKTMRVIEYFFNRCS